MESFSIENLDLSKDLRNTESSLEFLLLSLCKHLDLKPKQAAGLLTHGGKYLSCILTRGLKGRGEPILSWYKDLKSNVHHISSLSTQEEGSVLLILSSLKSGFLSKHMEVVKACADLFGHLAAFLQVPGTWEWFISEGGGLEASLISCRLFGASVKQEIAFVITEFARGHLFELFTIHLKNQLVSPIHYFATVNELLPAFCANNATRQELLSRGVIEFWMDIGLKEAKENTADLRLAAINFLCDLWVHIPESVEIHEGTAQNVLDILKTGYRDRQALMKYACLGKLFYLLQVFTEERNSYASTVYKTLTFSLVENYEVLEDREFIVRNFILIFRQVESIPVGVLMEPLMKQLQVTPELSYNVSDFDFFCEVSKHPRFSQASALQLLDILGRVIANEIEYSNIATVPFMKVAQRFHDDPNILEYLSRLVKYALKLVQNATSKKQTKDTVNKILADETLTDRKFQVLQQKIMLDFLSKVLLAGISSWNKIIKKELIKASLYLKRNHATSSPQILNLLKQFGNPGDLIDKFERADPLKLDSTLDKPTNRSPTNSNNNIVMPRVLQDIQKVREKRLEKIQRLEEIQVLEERKKARLMQMTPKYVDHNFIYAPLAEEEENLVSDVLKRYSKALKFLFKKYSSTGYTNRNSFRSSFDSLVDQNVSLTVSEFYRMLKEQGVSSAMVSIEEATALAKGYSSSLKRLKFREFKGLLTQTAIHAFSKPPTNLTFVEPGYLVKKLFMHFREFGTLPVQVFDDPDPGFGDKEVVRKLNAQIQSKPNLSLPEGYKRISQVDVNLSYYQPTFPKMKKSLVTSLEILDNLLNGLFGVHILEPFVSVSTTYSVKGVLPKVTVSPSKDRSLNSKYYMTDMGITYHKAHYHLRIPPEVSVSPAIRYEMVQLNQKYPTLHVLEVGKLLEDVLFSVEVGSNTLVTTRPKIQNRVLQMKEQQMKNDIEYKARQEYKRQVRQQMLEAEVKKSKIERQAMLQELERKQMDETNATYQQFLAEQSRKKARNARKAEAVYQWKLQREKAFSQRVELSNLESEKVQADKQKKIKVFLKQEQAKIDHMLKQGNLGGLYKSTKSIKSKSPSISPKPSKTKHMQINPSPKIKS